MKAFLHLQIQTYMLFSFRSLCLVFPVKGVGSIDLTPASSTATGPLVMLIVLN